MLAHHPSEFNKSEIHMVFPSDAEGKPSYVLYMAIKNISEMPLKWSWMPRYDCKCPIIEDPTKIYRRVKVYKCPHRELFTLEPNMGELEVKLISVYLKLIGSVFIFIQNKMLFPLHRNSMYGNC